MSHRATPEEKAARSKRILELRAAGVGLNAIAREVGTNRTEVWRVCTSDSADDLTPGCVRCGLRGEHSCVPRAEAYLGRSGEQMCVRNKTV